MASKRGFRNFKEKLHKHLINYMYFNISCVMLSQDGSCYDLSAAFFWLGRLPWRRGSRGGDVAITSPFFCPANLLWSSQSAGRLLLYFRSSHLNNHEPQAFPSRVEPILWSSCWILDAITWSIQGDQE